MEYFDFIKPGELDDLPEDPKMAFARIVELAQARLTDRIGSIQGDERSDYELIQDARYGFQNVIIAIAKELGVTHGAITSAIRRGLKQSCPEIRSADTDRDNRESAVRTETQQ